MNTITVQELLDKITEKKIMNSNVNPTALEDFLKSELEIQEYIPFIEKRKIIEKIIQQNIYEENGIKKIDGASQYVGFIIAMLISHTSLQIEDPITDYDTLNKSGLLKIIMSFFEKDYSECNTLLKMTTAQELESNNLNCVVAKFLDKILLRIDNIGEFVRDKVGDADISEILGNNFQEEDVAALRQFLDINK